MFKSWGNEKFEFAEVEDVPRPKGSKINKIVNKKIHLMEITCGMCGKEKKESEYYISYNPLHKNGKLPFCKKCLKDSCYDDKGKLDVNKINKMLQMVDRPFIYDLLRISSESGHDTVGNYFKNLQLVQYRHFGYEDSVFKPQAEHSNVPKQWEKKEDEFQLTDEIEEFFGYGFTEDEYRAMFKKYTFLKNNYPETTNMHVEALKTYVRYKIKEEFAIAKGDVGTASKWAELSAKAATSAKINPSQLSKADLSGGLNSVSELIKATEQAVDIIPILPQFKFRPNDALDFVIWCYVNYTRDLKGLPACEYADVYSFYDRKKQEYIDQYGDLHGIFKEDPTEENREKLIKFIVQPSVGDNEAGDSDG